MLVGTGGGGGVGCFGLGEAWDGKAIVALNGGGAIPFGERVQLCVAGYRTDAPVEVTVDGPGGFRRAFRLLLQSAPIPKWSLPRLDGILFGAARSEEVTPGRYDASIFATDYAILTDKRGPDAGLGDYTVRARQGTTESVATNRIVPHFPPTGTVPQVVVAGGQVGISAVGPAGQLVDIGVYEDISGKPIPASGIPVRLLMVLPRLELDGLGVGSIVRPRSELPAGPFCVLTRSTSLCLDGNRVGS